MLMVTTRLCAAATGDTATPGGRDGTGSVRWLSFVDDLGVRVAEIARRGIEPAKRETYDNGVTKVSYRDAEGNEISLGGASG
jgi:hypothetical protein